jgi:hypothetical protein
VGPPTDILPTISRGGRPEPGGPQGRLQRLRYLAVAGAGWVPTAEVESKTALAWWTEASAGIDHPPVGVLVQHQG